MSAAAQAHRGREGSALDGFVNEGITEDAGVIDQAGGLDIDDVNLRSWHTYSFTLRSVAKTWSL